MLSPSLAELKQFKKGTLTPVYKEILADLETPVSVFLKVSHNQSSAVLLESVELGEKLGRFSFICFDFKRTLTSINNSIYAEEKGGARKKISGVGDVLHLFEREIKEKESRFLRCAHLPAFQGGYVGYLSYENVRFYEKIKLNPDKKAMPLPESVFFWTDQFIVFDHIDRKIRIVKLVECNSKLGQNYKKAVLGITAVEKRIQGALPRSTHKKETGHFSFTSNVPKNTFLKQVERIKEYIRAGDCIQVVVSQRFDMGSLRDDFSTYRVLRSLNPSPYMFYFKYKNMRLVGSSPEMLVKKTGRCAEVRPIAGTRRRGRDEAEDRALEQELKNSKKEMAEHLMLVDLGRNDLGRVSEPGSVRVKDFARIERYSHVMHLVSEVVGTLSHKHGSTELLRATFPAGTVSGAPKIRAMEIIDELEKETRGPYAGSVGYFSLTGDMDMCITIRTVVIHNHRAYVQSGAGIVSDSEPQAEYEETVNKAKALFQAAKTTKENGLV